MNISNHDCWLNIDKPIGYSSAKVVSIVKKITGAKNLVMAGGVALNCVANGALLREKIFENIWLQPASGDAGGALGVAQTIYFDYLNNHRYVDEKNDNFLGDLVIPFTQNIDYDKNALKIDIKSENEAMKLNIKITNG